MSFADPVARIVERFSKSTHENEPVSLDDVKRGGWWRNKKGRKIKVDPEKMIYEEDGNPIMFGDFEVVQKILFEGGYTHPIVPDTSSDAALSPETQEAESGVSVVDVESHGPNKEQGISQEQIFAKLQEIAGILRQSGNEDGKASVNRLSAEVSGLYRENLTEEERTNRMRVIFGEAEALLDTMKTRKSVKKRGGTRAARRAVAEIAGVATGEETPSGISSTASDDVVVGTLAAQNGNFDALFQAAKNASEATSLEETVKMGDPGGLEDAVNFKALLKARQEKILPHIDAIMTPGDFAAFRRTMRRVQLGDSQEVRWYFINQKTLREEVSKNENLGEIRELNDAEKQQLYALEDFLRDKMRKKFFELKDADVANFYNQEQAKIIATQSEVDLEALGASWPKQLEDIAAWKGLLDTLTEVEKNKIKDGYDEAVGTLKQNIEIRKRELQLAPAYQALDVFLARGDKAKEKARMFQEIIDKEYGAWSNALHKEAKKIGGTISSKRRWALWQEQGGDAVMERVIVTHLQRFDGIDPEEGKKIFQALRETLMEKTKQGA